MRHFHYLLKCTALNLLYVVLYSFRYGPLGFKPGTLGLGSIFTGSVLFLPAGFGKKKRTNQGKINIFSRFFFLSLHTFIHYKQVGENSGSGHRGRDERYRGSWSARTRQA